MFNWNTLTRQDWQVIGLFVTLFIIIASFGALMVSHSHKESVGYSGSTENWTTGLPEDYSPNRPYGDYAYWNDESDPRNIESPIAD